MKHGLDSEGPLREHQECKVCFCLNLSRKKPDFHLCSALRKPAIIHRFRGGRVCVYVCVDLGWGGADVLKCVLRMSTVQKSGDVE